MSNDPAFDPTDKAEKSFFEKFMSEVTPPPKITVIAANGAALIFRSVDANEFRKIENSAKPFIEMVSKGKGLAPDWKPYQIKDAGTLFKLFFLWETMDGWHQQSKIVDVLGATVPEGEEIPEGAQRVPHGPLEPKWDQKSWLWFAYSSPVAYKAVEAVALQSQATGTAAGELKAVKEAGEDSSGTS